MLHRSDVPLSQQRALVVVWDDVDDAFGLRLLAWCDGRFEFKTPIERAERAALITQVDSARGSLTADRITVGATWNFLAVELDGQPFGWGAVSLYRSSVRQLDTIRSRRFARR